MRHSAIPKREECMINMVRRVSRDNNKAEIPPVMGTSVMKICSISSSEGAEEVGDSNTSTFSMAVSNSNKKRSYLTTLMLSSLI
jgi:hypothetical protein